MSEFSEYATFYIATVTFGFVLEALRATLWGVVIYVAVRAALSHYAFRQENED